MFFSAKITKMPPINPRFDQRPNEVQTLAKQRFSQFYTKPKLLGDFVTTLTKFDSKLILGGPKNPNFDLAIRTG